MLDTTRRGLAGSLLFFKASMTERPFEKCTESISRETPRNKPGFNWKTKAGTELHAEVRSVTPGLGLRERAGFVLEVAGAAGGDTDLHVYIHCHIIKELWACGV